MLADGRRKRTVIAAATTAVLLLTAYVLSIGPATWLALSGYITSELFEVIYYPIDWLSLRSETLRQVILWYQLLWTPN
jgi:hypothetical protein